MTNAEIEKKLAEELGAVFIAGAWCVQNKPPNHFMGIPGQVWDALVKERMKLERLEKAMVVFKLTRGMHFGPHNSKHVGCSFCEESYVQAESQIDGVFGIQHDTQVERAIQRLRMDGVKR